MFQKVLINDDHDAILSSITQILSKLNVGYIERSQYCDEAYLKIKRAELDEMTFDLLITDLSFKRDHRNIDLDSGEDLIEKLRLKAPDMPIIVYSMKDQLQKVRQLVKSHNINGYVCKDRKGSRELEEAIKAVSEGKRYLSPQVSGALSPRVDLEIEDYDVQLLKLLSKGLSQDEISSKLKSKDISPNSLSTIEKRLNKLRIQFKAHNVIHLVATAKDLGLI
ncbi:response regulator [Psychroserpens jangbogonensis]|uniref:response regulator n=1 Tax=Psychroserpens jangbogonensis TaxID=1484460 RepID=UPI00053E377D|nr:response regulator [Psychroserpens jangbogonensis]